MLTPVHYSLDFQLWNYYAESPFLVGNLEGKPCVEVCVPRFLVNLCLGNEAV